MYGILFSKLSEFADNRHLKSFFYHFYLPLLLFTFCKPQITQYSLKVWEFVYQDRVEIVIIRL